MLQKRYKMPLFLRNMDFQYDIFLYCNNYIKTKIQYIIFIAFSTYIKIGGIILNKNDIQALMNILSKMDKKQLEEGLNKASNFLSPKEKEAIL